MPSVRYHPPKTHLPLSNVQVWMKRSVISTRTRRNKWLLRLVVFCLAAAAMGVWLFQHSNAATTALNPVLRVELESVPGFGDFDGIHDYETPLLKAEKTLTSKPSINDLEQRRERMVVNNKGTGMDLWPLKVPTNLSLSENNPDNVRMRAVSSFIFRRSIPCSHVKFLKSFGFIACGYEDQIFAGSERQRVAPVLWHLFRDRTCDFIDIGASTGLHSLAAAAIGRRVVSVEPVRENQVRLVKAAITAGHSERIVVVPYAVSNLRLRLKLRMPRVNQAKAFGSDADCESDDEHICSDEVHSLVMDELLPFIPFSRAVLRLGTSTFALESLVQHSKRFFSHIDVPVICMTWAPYVKRYYGKYSAKKRVDEMIEVLLRRNYDPLDGHDNLLDVDSWAEWPPMVFWLRRGG